jgi:hypothetical protein
MTSLAFKPGDQVLSPRTEGTVIDVRATPTGAWVYGVEYSSGEVAYFTSKALRRAEA